MRTFRHGASKLSERGDRPNEPTLADDTLSPLAVKTDGEAGRYILTVRLFLRKITENAA